MDLILCNHCKTLKPALSIGPSTLLRIAEVLADGSMGRAIGEVRADAGCDESTARKWIEHFGACCWPWPVTEEDNLLLRQADAAFGHLKKPEHFTNYTHCAECAEHDETLRAGSRETLSRKDLGNPGWDPLTFTSEEGIGYLFPALARFTPP